MGIGEYIQAKKSAFRNFQNNKRNITLAKVQKENAELRKSKKIKDELERAKKERERLAGPSVGSRLATSLKKAKTLREKRLARQEAYVKKIKSTNAGPFGGGKSPFASAGGRGPNFGGRNPFDDPKPKKSKTKRITINIKE